jgi:hypothetical protein
MTTFPKILLSAGTILFLLGIGPCGGPSTPSTTNPVVETEVPQIMTRVCTRPEQKACITSLFQCLSGEITNGALCTQALIDKCEADRPTVDEDIPPEGSCNVCRQVENYGYMNSVKEIERKFRCPPRTQ